MKVAVLWTGLSGYLNACLKELASREGVELFVCHQALSEDAPFDENQFKWILNRFQWERPGDLQALGPRLQEFAPEILVIAGWHVPVYRKLARAYAGKSWRVMVMDNPWTGSLKQWLGVCTAPIYLQPLADAAWLPGERQAIFAKKLGFRQSQILRGSFSCDQAKFAEQHLARVAQGRPVPRTFIFAGRFIAIKGIDFLAEAYRRYRRRLADPWSLICCGSGPLRPLLDGQPGIQVRGFVQPEGMAAAISGAGCLILCSKFDHWSLAVHEATSAGLAILASEVVGATVHLVQPGFNGFVFDHGDVDGLVNLMVRVSSMSESHLNEMSKASYLLSQQFSPVRWADTLIASHAARSKPLSVR